MDCQSNNEHIRLSRCASRRSQSCLSLTSATLVFIVRLLLFCGWRGNERMMDISLEGPATADRQSILLEFVLVDYWEFAVRYRWEQRRHHLG